MITGFKKNNYIFKNKKLARGYHIFTNLFNRRYLNSCYICFCIQFVVICCFIYLFDWFVRERGRKGERERKRNIDLLFRLFMHSSVALCMRPDWGLNPQPRHIGNDALINWATQPGPVWYDVLKGWNIWKKFTLTEICS